MMRIILASTLALSLLGLAACGSSTTDRALSGAGIGAAAGLLGGALLDAPVEGAAIGAVVGGAAGAMTDQKDFDLGEPFWR